jgi:uracil-DNA glycosylase
LFWKQRGNIFFFVLGQQRDLIIIFDMKPKAQALKIIEKEIESCDKCPLGKTRNKTVPGSGDPSADILFIGEAPGQKEDQQGVPFCGAAGKFLDQMLNSIGLNRDDVFIANTLKCRPPNNRDPEPGEKEACREYLDRQLQVIKPKLIVCLGGHSVSNFMPEAGGISKLHGKTICRANGQTYLALYHPAAALHNGGLRKTLLEDFQKIPQIIKKINEINTNDHLINSDVSISSNKS